MLMGERRVRHGLGRLVSMFVLGISIGTVMLVHAQSSLPSLWLEPPSLSRPLSLWSPSPNVWVKCARSGMITDHGVKLLIAPDLGSECYDIIQRSPEYMFCFDTRGFGSAIMSPLSPRACYELLVQAENRWQQPEVLRGNWFWRLEKPDDAYGSYPLSLNLERWPEFQRNLENARDEVKEIVEWAGDIWHIDRDVDGRAARIVQSLRENKYALGVHTCPMERGDAWYTVGEDGMSVQTSPTIVDVKYVRVYQDASNEGYERRICVRFGSEMEGASAVEQLANDVEEGLKSDADFWENLHKIILNYMMTDFQKGVPTLQNRGMWLALQIESTRGQRPLRTLTLQSTGETIQLWIGTGPTVGKAFVKVRWINTSDSPQAALSVMVP